MVTKPTNFLIDQYKLVYDSYTGQNGFANGDYLFKFDRERDFEQRKKEATYTNYVKPIVDSTIDPIFSETPRRSYNNEDVVTAFINDCNNNGTRLDRYIKEATLHTVLNSNHFVIMDNYPETPETLQEALGQRVFPYIYTKKLSDIYSFETDKFGKLISISFKYGIYDTEKNLYLYREFTNNAIEQFTINEYNKRTTIDISTNDIGVIPVVYYNTDILPYSPYYSMATIARQVYNQDSRINDLDISSDFNILVIPSTNPTASHKTSAVVGNKNAMYVDSESTVMPHYISAPSDTLKTSMEYKSSTINTMLQIADVLGSSAVVNGGNKAESGTALGYRFYGKMNKLKSNGMIAEYYEKEIIRLLSMYIGRDIEYTVDYSSILRPSITEVMDKVSIIERVSDREITDDITAKLNESLIELVGGVLGWSDEDISFLSSGIPTVYQVQ